MANCNCKAYRYNTTTHKCNVAKYNTQAASIVIGLLVGLLGDLDVFAVANGSCAHNNLQQPSRVAFGWFKGVCIVQSYNAHIINAIAKSNWGDAGSMQVNKRTGIARVSINVQAPSSK
jgi:hypothetical protein